MRKEVIEAVLVSVELSTHQGGLSNKMCSSRRAGGRGGAMDG